MDKQFARIQFKGYMVDYMKFRLNPDYNPNNTEIEMDIDFKHGFSIDEKNNEFQCNLICEIFKDYVDNIQPFYLKTSLTGMFSYDSSLEEKGLKQMLKINSTAILFPYLRTIISTVTTMFSVGCIILPTFNISALLERKNNAQI